MQKSKIRKKIKKKKDTHFLVVFTTARRNFHKINKSENPDGVPFVCTKMILIKLILFLINIGFFKICICFAKHL